MAFPVTLNGRTYTLADFSGTNYVEGFPDALQDFVTQAGNIYTTTSTSSVAIGTGSKTFTVADSGKPYTVGTPLRIADAAAPATNWIDGIVTSYSGTTLVVNAVAYAGSGTIASWNINIGGSAIAYTGTLPVAQGGTGATTAADARTNLDTYSKAEADSRFLNVSGEASNVTMTGNVTIGDAGTDTLTVNATATMADATLTTADINGGTIDGTVIGGSTPAAIRGTTGTYTGNVGIGTSSPERQLHINGPVGALRLQGTTGGGYIEIKGPSNTNYIGTPASISSGSTTDLGFYVSSLERMLIDSSGNVLCGSDGGGDIGSSTKRFKDLYLSGGVYLGGTGAANYLDDYEEGTWTPTVTSAAGTVTLNDATGSFYTKIGRTVQVYARFEISTDASVGTSNLTIGGLPFAVNQVGSGNLVSTNYSLGDYGTGGAHGFVYAISSSLYHVERTVDISSRTTFIWTYYAVYTAV